MSDTVQVSIDQGVMTVTINRPEAMNAVNREVAEGIAVAMIALDRNPEIRLAILTGAGGMFFLRHGSESLCPWRVALHRWPRLWRTL